MMAVSAVGTGTRVTPEGPRHSDKTGPQTAKAGGDLSFLQKREEEHARAIRTDWERSIGDPCSRSPAICTSSLRGSTRCKPSRDDIANLASVCDRFRHDDQLDEDTAGHRFF